MLRFVVRPAILVLAWSSLSCSPIAQAAEKSGRGTAGRSQLTPELLRGLALRNIGPAFMSGRIADVIKDPKRESTWYVGVASGNVWKTTNAGTTWTPIFDRYGAYSIGTLAIDPKNSSVVWLGTGEANATRSVSFGDGVYKSTDGGASWERLGLERSEHIAKIVIDPRDSNVVYVASQGPLWSPGGDRGLYKSTDGGKTWKPVLQVSENTGISDVVLDPRHPDVLYAASYQRRRHAGILIAGGPESAIYKSADGGASWRTIMPGIPTADRGRIGLAISPQNPDVLYAIVAAARDESGFFRSSDRGETWERQSNYIVVDSQYYMRLFPDPHRFDRVYAIDVRLHVTDDGGKTFRPVNDDNIHMDQHALVFDPDDPEYLLLGNDGGLYESWDRGRSWKFITNLPVTQFYRVGVDNDEPFYNVYGGTQDNGTQGGPSRTLTLHGIRNADWKNIISGDGWQVRVDPEDPNIVYGISQYGELRRYDRRTGEATDIRPMEAKGEPPVRYHWDSPHIISPHSHTRLYFAGSRVWRSDDRGDSWRGISGDLSRGLDRNRLEVMGTVWSVDAVWKNVFTNEFGTVISLSESPRKEGLLYAGTDDGLLQVTEDGGAHWRRVDGIASIPELASAVDVVASSHDIDTVYAIFNNHQRGDFAPYVLKSTNRGKSWTSIAGDLPRRGPVWSLVEDHVNPNLLFVGTEFGLFFTVDGGRRWVPLTGGVPTIAFRDLELQRRENDLVGATFGRGMFILDDYTPLRALGPEQLAREAALFPVRRAQSYLPKEILIFGPKGTLGDNEYVAPNPPFGAIITYYLRDELLSRRARRIKEEEALRAAKRPVYYPSWDALRREEREPAPAVFLTVSDAAGRFVRRIRGPATAGLHRVAWDLRYASPAGGDTGKAGPLAAPGRYTVHMSKWVEGVETPLGASQTFEVVSIVTPSLPAPDRGEVLAFELKAERLQSAVESTLRVVEERHVELAALAKGLREVAGDPKLADQALALDVRLVELVERLTGRSIVKRKREPVAPAVVDRIERVVQAQWETTSVPTQTRRRDYEIAAEEFAEILRQLRTLVDEELPRLEKAAAAAGLPWKPGRPLPTAETITP